MQNLDYPSILKHYEELLALLKDDDREVSQEMIQTIRDDIEDILIILGRASQLQPKLCNSTIGFETDF